MDKGKLNFVIDALMFLCLMAMAGLGFLMYYILSPGRRIHAVYGRNVDLTWLGWDRHDWGDLHLYLAFILLGLLTVHLILHWSMIVGLCARLLPDRKVRLRVVVAFLVIALLFIYFPFLITPEVGERGGGGGRGMGRPRSEAVIMEPQKIAQAAPDFKGDRPAEWWRPEASL
jgi:Domain of unknown function (DUF4405)